MDTDWPRLKLREEVNGFASDSRFTSGTGNSFNQEEEIVRKYQPTLKKYGVYFDDEICSLIENCPQNLECRIQAFIGWFLSLEYRALLENKNPNFPDANETLVRALKEEWYPTEYQQRRLLAANLFPADMAMRNKLAEINFFKPFTANSCRQNPKIQTEDHV